MAITQYKIVKAPVNDAEAVIGEWLSNGWQPLGAPVMVEPNSNTIHQAMTKGSAEGSFTEFSGLISAAQTQAMSGTGKAFPSVVDGFVANAGDLPDVALDDYQRIYVFSGSNVAWGVQYQYDTTDPLNVVQPFWNEVAYAKVGQEILNLDDNKKYSWSGTAWVEV